MEQRIVGDFPGDESPAARDGREVIRQLNETVAWRLRSVSWRWTNMAREQEMMRTVAAVMERFGLRFKLHHGGVDRPYRGDGVIRLGVQCTSYPDMLHEVAHWIVAGPENRLKVDYGLSGWRRKPDERFFWAVRWEYQVLDAQERLHDMFVELLDGGEPSERAGGAHTETLGGGT